MLEAILGLRGDEPDRRPYLLGQRREKIPETLLAWKFSLQFAKNSLGNSLRDSREHAIAAKADLSGRSLSALKVTYRRLLWLLHGARTGTRSSERV
jgi:hypothetical protein